MIIYSKVMCYFSFFDEENADHTLGLTTVKTKEMFRLPRVGVISSRLRVFFPFLLSLFWYALFQNKASYIKNLRAFLHRLPTKPPALVFCEARRLSWPKLLIFTPFDTAMFALPDRPYFRTRPFMIRIWDHCLVNYQLSPLQYFVKQKEEEELFRSWVFPPFDVAKQNCYRVQSIRSCRRTITTFFYGQRLFRFVFVLFRRLPIVSFRFVEYSVKCCP